MIVVLALSEDFHLQREDNHIQDPASVAGNMRDVEERETVKKNVKKLCGVTDEDEVECGHKRELMNKALENTSQMKRTEAARNRYGRH